jgi:hypothetical protein
MTRRPKDRTVATRRSSSSAAAVTFVLRSASDAAAPAAGGATRGAAPQQLPAGLQRGELRHSLQLAATRGTAVTEQRVQAEPGRDVVVLRLAGGPALVLHPQHARDLLQAQHAVRSATRGGADGDVAVPTELRWGAPDASGAPATRGLLGNVLLAGLDIVRDSGGASLSELAADRVAARVDVQVRPGVYALDADALPRLKDSGRKPLASIAAADGPLLVLLHGTFSNTAGAFGKLWSTHPQQVAALFAHYGARVFGFEHATLQVSPVANALALARTLPRHAALHLLTHSRGGLVAEVLARVAAHPTLDGEDLRAFSADDRRNLTALGALLRERQVRVERIVRVACPVRGTLLASGRLDAYLSLFKWTLELSGVPVLPELVEFLAAVAQRRTDPQALPGLAAQMPGSALIQWLHAAREPLPGQLRVVAGDAQGDSVGSWLKTLASDGFFWTDNDFVVQTRSMYGGAPRAGGASFLLDRSARVSHGAYFVGERSAEAVCNALTQEQPSGFAPIGPLSWAGASATGVRGALPARDAESASARPAVILLPGILGSHLALDGERVWLSSRIVGGLKQLAWPDAAGHRITPDGAIGACYDELAAYLAATHEVIEFSFDWRRPIEQEAQRLAKVAEAALVAREASAQPVRFVAHSMGGLVVRALQLEAPELFERLMAHPGARVLMLGTPNAGSWAPMQVLSGDDTFGNTLIAFGAPLQDASARAVMARMPGFLQLQAGLTDARLGLADAATWKQLAERDLATVREWNRWHGGEGAAVQDEYRWGVPTQAVLDQALALRERLDAQVREALPRFVDRWALVVGQARFTPDGFDEGPQGLAYLNAVEAGDGRVTRASARLPGLATWSVDAEHGALPGHAPAFAAYAELLESGHTAALPRLPDLAAAVRGGVGAEPRAARHVRSRPSREPAGFRAPQSMSDLGASSARSAPERVVESSVPALAVSVLNGNLMFVRQPLMIGHYRSTRLSGSEGAVNNLLGGSMAASLGAGVYPDGPGAFQMFRNTRGSDNPLQLPRPEWAIVVGLGDESELKPASLLHTVRQAIIGWAQRTVEGGSAAATFELAATLIGSGGTRIAPGQAAQLIAQAAREANLRLKASGWPLLTHLVLVELYLDRASEAWRSLNVLASRRSHEWRITNEVRIGAGALRIPLDSGYRGADYDLISATSEGPAQDADSVIAYTLDTRRARTEVRAQATQATLVREMVKRASNERNQDPQIGRTLYQLLVPVEMDPFMGGTTEARIELDAGTAGIPWELLHNTGDVRNRAAADSDEDTLPWAIRTKLLRKLRTTRFRQTVSDATLDSDMLVIGEPAVPRELGYARLPGARREAHAVAERLTGPGGFAEHDVRTLIAGEDAASAPDAHQVINALLERDWRIVHIAGHGEPPERIVRADGSSADGDPRGVVLSHGCYLGPREIRTMRAVPELVFVNCCFLAERHADQLLRGDGVGAREYDRARFASGVAEELIRTGVRCVVAAGWAVEDVPAEAFAATFYEALVGGARFIDAAALARQAAWEQRGSGNTWAAYQCYGDPDWRLRLERGERRAMTPADKFAGISSPVGLAIALETVAVETRFLRADERAARLPMQRERVAWLESRFGTDWGRIGAVAEAFAVAYNDLGDTARALTWYGRAVAANDASASQRAAEQWANLRARDAEGRVHQAAEALEGAQGRRARRARSARADEAALAQHRAALQIAVAAARAPLREALRTMERLLALHGSVERESLAGSICKRIALVETAAGAPAQALRAVQRMRGHYARAERMARAADLPELYYPALNRMAAELVADAGNPGWPGFDVEHTALVRQRLADKTRDDPDFWSVAGLTELRVYEAVAAGRLAGALGAIVQEYDELHRRVSGTHHWRSLYDTTRFVLEVTGARAGAADRKAGESLVALLEGFAWPA